MVLKHLVTLWCLLSCFLRYNIRFAYQAQQFKGNLKATHFIGLAILSQFTLIYDGFHVIYKLTLVDTCVKWYIYKNAYSFCLDDFHGEI